MNTLDRQIIYIINSFSTQPEGVYPYFVKRQVSSGVSEEIFAGNFYYNGIDTLLKFDVTDIISSDGFVITEDEFEGVYSLENKLINKYNVTVKWSDSYSSNSTFAWVAKVYGYRNKKLYSDLIFFNPDALTTWVSITMQGFSKNGSVLIPHYPMYNDEQVQSENDCPFALSFLAGDSVSGISATFEVDSYARQWTITPSGNSFTYICSVTTAADYRDITPLNDGVLKLDATIKPDRLGIKINQGNTYLYVRYTDGDYQDGDFPYAFALVMNTQNKNINDSSVDWDNISTSTLLYANSTALTSENLVYDDYYTSPDVESYEVIATKNIPGGQVIGGYIAAIFDVCPKRYYLFWQDRLGSFQCQAFNDHAKYSETITRTEVQDYQNRRRNANIQVEGKWSLNSGWIPEDLYPYYESIYTSQILILFDTTLNKRFTVLVSGDYEEKNYRNQKKMINMNLELTENKKQNHIY